MIAKISNPFESFNEKICVITNTDAIKIAKNSNEKLPSADVIIKNQNDNPAVTASDLNLGDESSKLDGINKCNQTRLSK